MGSVLDSPKDIRQRKKSPSRKAHCSQKKLEKDKTKGINMADQTQISNHADTLLKIVDSYCDGIFKRNAFEEKSGKATDGLTYFRFQENLSKKLDDAVKEINDSDFTNKIEDFKKYVFCYEDNKEDNMPIDVAGIETLQGLYYDSIEDIFGISCDEDYEDND